VAGSVMPAIALPLESFVKSKAMVLYPYCLLQ